MPPVALIIGVLVACICLVGLAVGIYFATQGGDDSKSPSPASGTPASGTPASGTPASGTPAAKYTTSAATSYTPSGYLPLPLSSLPATFSLKNTATGKYWGGGVPNVTDGGATISITAESPSDLYSATGTGLYRFKAGSAGYIRHAGYVMHVNPYSPNNFDFAWQIMLKTGTTDQVIVWNMFPGDNKGMGVITSGGVQKIDPGTPTVYTLVPTTSSSWGASSFVPEPFSFIHAPKPTSGYTKEDETFAAY